MSICLSLLALFIINTEIPAKISYLVGNATLQRGNKSYIAVLNTALSTNDIITTLNESVCEIQFSNYSLIRLEPNSSIKIEQKEETKKGIFNRIFTSFGEIVSKVTKLNKGDEYEVKTDAAHAFIRGTTFKTLVEKDGTSSFSVLEGKISVKSLIAGAKEVLLDKDFKTKFTKGQLKPLVEKLPLQEIENFKKKYKDFIDRGKVMDELREKFEKEIKEKKDEMIKKGKSKLKGCIFW